MSCKKWTFFANLAFIAHVRQNRTTLPISTKICVWLFLMKIFILLCFQMWIFGIKCPLFGKIFTYLKVNKFQKWISLFLFLPRKPKNPFLILPLLWEQIFFWNENKMICFWDFLTFTINIYWTYTQYRNIRNGGVFPVLGLFL